MRPWFHFMTHYKRILTGFVSTFKLLINGHNPRCHEHAAYYSYTKIHISWSAFTSSIKHQWARGTASMCPDVGFLQLQPKCNILSHIGPVYFTAYIIFSADCHGNIRILTSRCLQFSVEHGRTVEREKLRNFPASVHVWQSAVCYAQHSSSFHKTADSWLSKLYSVVISKDR